MNELEILFIVGFLLAFEGRGKLALYRKQMGVNTLLSRSGRLLWQSSVLLALYFVCVEFWMPLDNQKDWEVAFLLLGAYGLSRIEKGSQIYFPCVFLIAFAASENPDLTLIGRVAIAFLLSFGAVIFQALILGVEEKLQFSPISNRVKGLGLLAVVAGILSLGLHSLYNLL